LYVHQNSKIPSSKKDLTEQKIKALDLLAPTLNIFGALTTLAKSAYLDKKTYEQKLETATGTDVYKYVLLINVSALEGYVAQARLQAQQSFNLSRGVAITGFGIIAIAIGLGVGFTITGNQNLNAAYLTGIAGILTEFTSGVFFFLYSKTLTQINLFHDKLGDMQKTALSHLVASSAKTDVGK
jgi:TRADD-N domain-containing protein